MAEWHDTTLGELADENVISVQTGPFGSQLHAYDYVDEGVRVVSTESISFRKLNTNMMPQISPATASKLSRHIVRAGDIVFARRGVQATGLSALVEPENEGYICGTGALRLRINDSSRLSSTFLSFALVDRTSRQWLRSHAVGAVMPNLNEEVIRGLPLRLPDIREQDAIGCILGALDDKIELNRRMNQTLEAMARAIFKSWFVDFDPVRANAAGQKPPDLVPAIAGLFPDSFVDSELGAIPSGWKITTLHDQIEIAKGLSYKGQYLSNQGEGLPMHNLNSVYEGGGYKHDGLKWYKGEYRPAHLLKPGDVIVTNTEQGFDYLLIGYAAIVPERYGSVGLFSHHIYRLRPQPTSYLPPWFFYLLLRTPRFHRLVAGHSNGTTVNMLPADGLQKPRFVLPPQALVERFEALFTPIQARLDCIVDENESLAALRDALLPRLISGELRVPDAERIVARSL